MNKVFKALSRIFIGNPVSEPGDIHPDGMVFAGYTENRASLYIPSLEAPLHMKWEKAVEHASLFNTMRAFGHTGWALPNLEQTELLAKNKEPLNKKAGHKLLSGYFWTAVQGTEKPGINAYMKNYRELDGPAEEEWVGNQANFLPVLLIPEKPDPALGIMF